MGRALLSCTPNGALPRENGTCDPRHDPAVPAKQNEVRGAALRRVVTMLTALCAALFVAVCGPGARADEPAAAAPFSFPKGVFSGTAPIKVVATVGMIGEPLARIGGPHLTIETLIGQGGDPHLYKPSPKDLQRMVEADLILYSGLHLEGRMGEVLEAYSKKKPVLALAERIPDERLIRSQGFAGSHDPHAWMDVSLWAIVAESIRDALAAFDPAHAEEYRKNGAEYLAELRALDSEIKATMATIPRDRRVLVTAHDAFNYFGRAYDIEVRGIQGISTESEAGLKDINDLVSFLVERKIPAVFVESSVSQKNVLALVEGAKARGHALRLGGELYSDAMGAAGTPDGTYIGMIRHNAVTIAHALTPGAPDVAPVAGSGAK